jgi:hypothetical protein
MRATALLVLFYSLYVVGEMDMMEGGLHERVTQLQDVSSEDDLSVIRLNLGESLAAAERAVAAASAQMRDAEQDEAAARAHMKATMSVNQADDTAVAEAKAAVEAAHELYLNATRNLADVKNEQATRVQNARAELRTAEAKVRGYEQEAKVIHDQVMQTIGKQKSEEGTLKEQLRGVASKAISLMNTTNWALLQAEKAQGSAKAADIAFKGQKQATKALMEALRVVNETMSNANNATEEEMAAAMAQAEAAIKAANDHNAQVLAAAEAAEAAGQAQAKALAEAAAKEVAEAEAYRKQQEAQAEKDAADKIAAAELAAKLEADAAAAAMQAKQANASALAAEELAAAEAAAKKTG